MGVNSEMRSSHPSRDVQKLDFRQQQTPKTGSLYPKSKMTKKIESQPLRIAICVCFLNAGVSTRGIEIGLVLREKYPDSTIRFFSWKGPPGMTYDCLAKTELCDFDVVYYGPPVDQYTWTALLNAEHSGSGFPTDFAEYLNANIRDLIKALRAFEPHAVVHGLLPDASMVCQIMGLPHILYAPVPFWDGSWLRDNKPKQPTLPPANPSLPNPFHEVALQWGLEPSGSVYESTRYLLMDLPSHYLNCTFSEAVRIVGPLFRGSASTKEFECSNRLSKPVQQWLQRYETCHNKVLVTVGSSGSAKIIMEAVRAICQGEFPALVALPKIRCSRNEIVQAMVEEGVNLPQESLILTEEFLPTFYLTSKVDCIVGHGGQGTVQTVIAAGKPFLGIALQYEQGWNIDQYIVKPHAGIRLQESEWIAPNIRRSIDALLHDPSYQKGATAKQTELKQALSRSGELSVEVIVSVAQANARAC